MPQGSAGWVGGCTTWRKGRGVDGRFWGWLFPSFSIFYDFRAAVHKSGNRCTLTHSILLGFSLYAKRGQEGLCGTFSWMVGTGKGGGRTWPGALVFWREGVSIHHGSHDERQASQHFLFCQDIGRTSIRTRHIGCITHTPTTSTTTTISYVNNTTAVESPTPTLSTDTHTQARRSWHQEGPAARRAAKYWLSGISPRLYLSRLCRCQRSLLLLSAPHQPSNQENRHT